MVDEYEGDLVYSWTIKSSSQPLTLRELLRLIDSIRIEGDIGRGESGTAQWTYEIVNQTGTVSGVFDAPTAETVIAACR